MIAPVIEEKDQFALEIYPTSYCIMNNTDPYIPGEEEIRDQKITEVFYKSAKEGQPINQTTIIKIDNIRGKKPDLE